MSASRLDILFVVAPKCEVNSPPLSVPSLAAYLRRRGFTCAVHDCNLDGYHRRGDKYNDHWSQAKQGYWTGPETVGVFFDDHPWLVGDLAARVDQEHPIAVGFTTWFTNFESSAYLAAKLKQRFPWVKTIAGGPEILMQFNDRRLEAARHAVFDAFAIGEGELTLAEILGRWREGFSLSGCPGAAFHEGGRLQMAGEQAPVRNLAVLPGPDYSDFDLPRYAAHGQMLTTYASRGCANHCIYCDEAVFWGRWRTKSGRQVFEEAMVLKERHPQMVRLYFCDSLINGHIGHLREFCELMTKVDPGFVWETNAVVRKEMEPGLLSLMRKAGCVRLIYGIESVSPALLERIGKRLCRNSNIEKVVRDTSAAGIGVWANFMFGLPGESEADAQASVDFCVRNKAYLETVVPTFAFCNLSPLTEAARHPERYGIKKNVHVCYWETEDGTNTFDARLSRFERFCRVMNREGIPMNYTFGDDLADRDRQLGNYYSYKRRLDLAIWHFERAMVQDPSDFITRRRLENCRSLLSQETAAPRH